jgi:hypothetical protein
MNVTKILKIQVRVDLGRRNVRMTQKFLNRHQIRAALQ